MAQRYGERLQWQRVSRRPPRRGPCLRALPGPNAWGERALTDDGWPSAQLTINFRYLSLAFYRALAPARCRAAGRTRGSMVVPGFDRRAIGWPSINLDGWGVGSTRKAMPMPAQPSISSRLPCAVSMREAGTASTPSLQASGRS